MPPERNLSKSSTRAFALPSPPFALLVGNGNVETFVIDVNKRPAGKEKKNKPRGCGWWKVFQVNRRKRQKRTVALLLVVVDEEALHDENVDPRVALVSLRRQADAVRAGELDWVLLPALHSADHSIHVQGSDH